MSSFGRIDMKESKPILNPNFDDREKIASLESELKALRKLVNLILEKLDID